MNWIDALPENRRRGSFPRCLMFVDGERSEVAERLTQLVDLPNVRVSENDFWMPSGIPRLKQDGTWDTTPSNEPELGEAVGFLGDSEKEDVKTWWLAVRRQASTPNWDIASTCTVAGRRGLLLVEAKAHAAELELLGKREPQDASPGRRKNHEQIGTAIAEANQALCNETGLAWRLSRDDRYQLSNRFAWAWKLMTYGYPVVLVYLGFLRAREMRDRGEPFADSHAWEHVVRAHSSTVVPAAAWGQAFNINSQLLMSLIRSYEMALPVK
jgi:hypothetical protein